jgi:hypothetical protein
MRPASLPHPQPTPLILTPKDEEILKYFAEYRFLTAQDIAHLIWVGKPPTAKASSPASSLTFRRARLSALSGNQDITDEPLTYGYPLWRIGFPTGRLGNQQRIWCLSATGAEIIKQLGHPMPWHVNPAKLVTLSRSTWLHDLSRNRFIVSLLAWAKSRPNLSIKSRLSYEISRHPPTVESSVQRSVLEKGKMVKVSVMSKVSVIPDGEILVTNTKTGERLLILLEIDQNTQAESRLRNHIVTRLAYARSQHFRHTYGNRYLIVYATQGITESTSKARLAHLCNFTMKLMDQRQRPQDGQYFRFASITFAELYEDAKRLFEEPSWYLPGDVKRQSPAPLFT